jgi:hypothetical protein
MSYSSGFASKKYVVILLDFEILGEMEIKTVDLNENIGKVVFFVLVIRVVNMLTFIS